MARKYFLGLTVPRKRHRFFRRFYVTNVLAVGYVKDGRSLSYHDLLADTLEVAESWFMEEVEFVRT